MRGTCPTRPDDNGPETAGARISTKPHNRVKFSVAANSAGDVAFTSVTAGNDSSLWNAGRERSHDLLRVSYSERGIDWP